jgi:type VI secretion system protein ImpK
MKTLGNPIVTGLPDLCADLFTYCLQLQRSKDPGDAETLRMRLDEMFRTLESRARQTEVPEPNVALAKYAIVAYVDEMILMSDWAAVKEVWQGRPLQLEYFNEFAAGEEFFKKLDTLRNTEDRKKIDVLEVYYTCLTLGFKGMYNDLQGMEKLKTMIESIGREVKKARTPAGDDGLLSPGWKPPDSMPMMVKNFPAWVIAVICGALLLILFIILALILNGVADSVRQDLG